MGPSEGKIRKIDRVSQNRPNITIFDVNLKI